MGGRHSKVWDRFYQNAVNDAVSISKELMEQTWSGRIVTKQQQSKLIMRMQADQAAKNQAILKQIWMYYDEDESGTLDEQEVACITEDSLMHLERWLPIMHQKIFEQSMEFSGKYLNHAQRRELKKLMERMLPAMQGKVHDWVAARLAEREKLAKRIWSILDEDKSGEVSEEEFLANYSSASIEVMDPMTVLENIEKDLYAPGGVINENLPHHASPPAASTQPRAESEQKLDDAPLQMPQNADDAER